MLEKCLLFAKMLTTFSLKSASEKLRATLEIYTTIGDNKKFTYNFFFKNACNFV